ncbi:uncharacterized protein LAJ45_06312 [Morchella importuna]|uniref:uncharacterized protein n=1 Tax=Morchella importuna TaxID=1174673 RepID=UPI001E8D0C52|nr:uncharacterized protein LAJ45_06312 [Morchella importuna]KAH8149681.1 hypothetical protein LAJ45_06312 [Morchella importuna]
MSEKREKEPEPRRGLSLYGGNDTVKPYMYMYVSLQQLGILFLKNDPDGMGRSIAPLSPENIPDGINTFQEPGATLRTVIPDGSYRWVHS